MYLYQSLLVHLKYKKSQLQYDRGSWSDAKLLICRYAQEYFQVLFDNNISTDEPQY